MELKTFSDHQQLSDAAANEIIDVLKRKPSAVICMASGETPRLTCRLLVDKVRQQGTDISRMTFIGLDEWVGVPPENDGSCHYFFNHELFQPLALRPDQTRLFDGMSADLQHECTAMNEFIASKGGIDLMIVGLGMNGHIGFNEPGVSLDNEAHVMQLDPLTISVGQKYFNTPLDLQQGITLGLKFLRDADRVILMANGVKKATVVRQTVQGDVSNQFPASIMQTLSQGVVMVDEEAAGELDRRSTK